MWGDVGKMKKKKKQMFRITEGKRIIWEGYAKDGFDALKKARILVLEEVDDK